MVAHNPFLRKSKGMVSLYVILFMLLLAGVLGYSTPREGFVDEAYWVTENVTTTTPVEELDCNIKISNNGKKTWTINDLGKNLTVEIDITSDEIIDLLIENVEGKCFRKKDKIILKNVSAVGPSLVISIHNPLDLTLKKAKLNGDLKIYETITELKEIKKHRKIPGIIYKPWWIE